MIDSSPAAASFDAVVVGGGPAGSAAAISLGRAARRVLLVERRPALGFKLGETVPPQARPLLEHLLGRPGDAGRAAYAFRTHGNASCWGSAEPAVEDFIFTPHGHGLRLNRPRFDLALRDAAREAGAEVALGARARRLEGGGPWRLTLARAATEAADATSTDVEAHFLIDCSGRSACAARRWGARVERWDRLFAFARTYELAAPREADSDTFTRIEATPVGWWYTVRLPGARRLVVFHTDRDLRAARVAATAAGFDELLAASRHVAPLLREHGYRAAGRPRGAAAGSQRLDRFTGAAGIRWLAAGDAAQAYDPLSSQGIWKALESGFAAGSAVARQLDGDAAALERYAETQETVQAEYRRHYLYCYSCERRWPDQPFWKRRQSREPTPARPREKSSCTRKQPLIRRAPVD